MPPYEVDFAPEAEAQLIALYRYIADAASPEIAQRFTASIIEHCKALDSLPHRGTPRDDLRPGLRTSAFQRRVTIAYMVAPEQVTILGVFYGGQDFDALLDE